MNVSFSRPGYSMGKMIHNQCTCNLITKTKKKKKKIILVPLRVLSLKKATAGALAVPFKVLSRNKKTRDDMLCKKLVALRGRKQSNHTHKTGSGVLFKH